METMALALTASVIASSTTALIVSKWEAYLAKKYIEGYVETFCQKTLETVQEELKRFHSECKT